MFVLLKRTQILKLQMTIYLSMALVRSIFRKDRNAYGGDVIIYSRNIVRVSRHNDLEPANVELVWLEIDNPTSQIF